MGATFDSIARGLNEAVAHAKGKKDAVELYQPEAVDVLALRQSIGRRKSYLPRGLGFLLQPCATGNAEIVHRMVRRWCC